MLSRTLFNVRFANYCSLSLRGFLASGGCSFYVLDAHVMGRRPVKAVSGQSGGSSTGVTSFLCHCSNARYTGPCGLPDGTVRRLGRLIGRHGFLIRRQAGFVGQVRVFRAGRSSTVCRDCVGGLGRSVRGVSRRRYRLVSGRRSIFSAFRGLLAVPKVNFIGTAGVVTVAQGFATFSATQRCTECINMTPYDRASNADIG